MLQEKIQAARAGRPLWMPELRWDFAAAEGAVPLVIRLTLCSGEQRDFHEFLPPWENEEERSLVREYLCACVYNLMAAYSGREMRFYYALSDTRVGALLEELNGLFQVEAPRRSGYGKGINIADRMCRRFGGGRFAFAVSDRADYVPQPRPKKTEDADLAGRLQALCRRAMDKQLCGIDVGGTDIKLAAAAEGRLVCVKEYDWNPAGSATAEGILEPILLLTRLMSACVAAREQASPALEKQLRAALEKDADTAQMTAAVAAAEKELGELRVLDGIGVSFPDIVIDDQIVGGETPKTKGMRENPALDYEKAFARLGDLRQPLQDLCREGGQVRLTNDGNMAAFTAAAELAGSPEADGVRCGVIAHTLGTDLGTGWLGADGRIPRLPLEMYDLILDLGSWPARALPPRDLRSTRNENSGLAGARRYMGQAAAYRLAWELAPELLTGFTAETEGRLEIAMTPRDLRKPCLEHLMEQAARGQPEAEEIFRRIGGHLGILSREMCYLLRPEPKLRFLFGRFVKSPRCFRLLCEGFEQTAPRLRLVASDEELACTPLMRQLAALPEVTVAQFGQAVGALYYALI